MKRYNCSFDENILKTSASSQKLANLAQIWVNFEEGQFSNFPNNRSHTFTPETSCKKWRVWGTPKKAGQAQE